MKTETQRKLNAINQAFYAAVAEDFNETRAAPWAGWEHALAALPNLTEAELAVLDLGCGNGRFARFLDGHLRQPFRYLGIDTCERLLELARADAPQRADLRFERLDVLPDSGEEVLPSGPFDLVVLFGLLHHIPGFEARRSLLASCADRLTSAGCLIATAWRFGAFDRFRSRFRSWDDYNAACSDAALRIEVGDLDAGDHLLDWRGGPAPRYCHFVDRSELSALVEGLGLHEVARFDADGKTGDLNEYVILQRD